MTTTCNHALYAIVDVLAPSTTMCWTRCCLLASTTSSSGVWSRVCTPPLSYSTSSSGVWSKVCTPLSLPPVQEVVCGAGYVPPLSIYHQLKWCVELGYVCLPLSLYHQLKWCVEQGMCTSPLSLYTSSSGVWSRVCVPPLSLSTLSLHHPSSEWCVEQGMYPPLSTTSSSGAWSMVCTPLSLSTISSSGVKYPLPMYCTMYRLSLPLSYPLLNSLYPL